MVDPYLYQHGQLSARWPHMAWTTCFHPQHSIVLFSKVISTQLLKKFLAIYDIADRSGRAV
jgi:hypothetical protein